MSQAEGLCELLRLLGGSLLASVRLVVLRSVLLFKGLSQVQECFGTLLEEADDSLEVGSISGGAASRKASAGATAKV